MTLFTDPRFKQFGFVGGTVSRHGGNMADLTNQHAVYKQLDILPQNILHFHQVHSANLITISTPADFEKTAHSPLTDADGWVFCPAPSQCGAAILTADCTPLFVWSADAAAWALSHCGWRGVAAGLPFKTVQALRQAGAKGPFYAWAGPHIQACCFEVQKDVSSQFPKKCLEVRNGKQFINLNTEIRAQLERAGVAGKDIVFDPHCTCCGPENFFSWRRDHVKNLLLSFMYKL